ncbi:MAG: YkgJ family cysteine cluster protein [Planctomycetota bacterium]
MSASNGLRFSCISGCTRCCRGEPGDIFVTRKELVKIAVALKTPVSDFEAINVRHYSSGKMSIKERPNGDCVLLTDKGCLVYPMRPKQCRDYPFWPEIMASEITWRRESQRCPGINNSKIYCTRVKIKGS